MSPTASGFCNCRSRCQEGLSDWRCVEVNVKFVEVKEEEAFATVLSQRNRSSMLTTKLALPRTDLFLSWPSVWYISALQLWIGSKLVHCVEQAGQALTVFSEAKASLGP